MTYMPSLNEKQNLCLYGHFGPFFLKTVIMEQWSYSVIVFVLFCCFEPPSANLCSNNETRMHVITYFVPK